MTDLHLHHDTDELLAMLVERLDTLSLDGSAGGEVGNMSDAAWNGTDPDASLISIAKACYAQLATIAANTGA